MTTYQRPYPPGALTTQQAADALGVSVDTVMRWLSEGRLTELEPPVGRRPRFFSQAEVKAFAAARGDRPLPRQWRDLSRQYGVSDRTIRHILNRTDWRHVA